MDRKRSVLTAGGISVVLVVGSSAFALANGIFVGTPATNVGGFQTVQARLVPAAKLVPTSVVSGAPPRERSAVRASPAAAMTATPTTHALPVIARQTNSAARIPAVRPAAARIISHSGPSAVSSKVGDDREDREDRDEHEGHDNRETERESARDD